MDSSRYAVVVALNHYDDPKFPLLLGDNNTHVCRALDGSDYIVRPLRPNSHIAPSKANILEAVSSAQLCASKDRQGTPVLLIYISGCCTVCNGETFIIPQDASKDTLANDDCLTLKEILQQFDEGLELSKARDRVLTERLQQESSPGPPTVAQLSVSPLEEPVAVPTTGPCERVGIDAPLVDDPVPAEHIPNGEGDHGDAHNSDGDEDFKWSRKKNQDDSGSAPSTPRKLPPPQKHDSDDELLQSMRHRTAKYESSSEGDACTIEPTRGAGGESGAGDHAPTGDSASPEPQLTGQVISPSGDSAECGTIEGNASVTPTNAQQADLTIPQFPEVWLTAVHSTQSSYRRTIGT